jgi:dethiobiotin synthetase
MRRIFITGTDTGIGKTYVSVKLLQSFNRQGLRTIGIKPVATGCVDGFNEDALLLQQYSSLKENYDLINPFAFSPSVSPNIASPNLTVDKILEKLGPTLSIKADVQLIEGVGGWLTPINLKETMADLVCCIENIEIILVVGLKLGCLNHALMSQKAIGKISGWIGNIVDPNMQAIEENILTLKQYIKAPCIEIIPYGNED